jgi:hypothetical protein
LGAYFISRLSVHSRHTKGLLDRRRTQTKSKRTQTHFQWCATRAQPRSLISRRPPLSVCLCCCWEREIKFLLQQHTHASCKRSDGNERAEMLICVCRHLELHHANTHSHTCKLNALAVCHENKTLTTWPTSIHICKTPFSILEITPALNNTLFVSSICVSPVRCVSNGIFAHKICMTHEWARKFGTKIEIELLETRIY